MPFTVEPRTASSRNDFASAAAWPTAIAVCPRGIDSVWITVPVAGSHSQ